MAEVARRETLVERRPGIGTVPRDPGRAALLAQPGRLVRGVRGELTRQYVAQVAEKVHRLVVAEHDVQRAAGRLGLALQPHQQVQHLARVGAAVEQVAGADDVRSATGPTHLRVDQVYGLQKAGEFVVSAMHVGKRDDARDVADGYL